MVSKIKEAIQDNLVKRRYRWYQEQIQKQTLTYDEWIREKEAQEDEALRAEHRAEHAEVISYDECRADFDVRRYAHGATPDGRPDFPCAGRKPGHERHFTCAQLV